jgi:seryl-tRNA synthetase
MTLLNGFLGGFLFQNLINLKNQDNQEKINKESHMLDIQFIRDNADAVRQATIAKGFDAKVVDELLSVDKARRELIAEVEAIRAKRNTLNDQLKTGRTDELIAKSKELKSQVEAQEIKLKELETSFTDLMHRVPNPSAADVVVGTPEANEVIKTVGTPRDFAFPVKDHVEIGELTDTIDLERGSKVAQSGFYYLKGKGAILEMALVSFAFSELSKQGFVPVITPNVAKEKNMVGCGFQARSDKERQVYHIEDEDLDLVATAEITLVGMHEAETFTEKELPKAYVGYSSCYRKERGSYGKDVRGILRVHEFRKVEMVVFTRPEDSDTWHDKLLAVEEGLWQKLGVPYQVIKMATGDLGNAASRKYDIEAWMPAQSKYREVTSTSNTTDFQARALGIKLNRGGKTEYLHTLNGTVFALGRAMIAIYENFQDESGSVKIPECLVPYTGFDMISIEEK